VNSRDCSAKFSIGNAASEKKAPGADSGGWE